MKRTLAVITVFTVLFAASGCVTSDAKAEKVFHGGNDGLKLSFVKLPEQVNWEQPFDIVVLAENWGEQEIPAGELQTVLNNAAAFNIEQNEALLSNPKAIPNILAGGELELVYSRANFSGQVISEEVPQALSVSVCYPYLTRVLVKKVCLAPSGTNKLCEYIGEKELENSGAPVHVTAFKQLNSVYNTGEEYIDLNVQLEFEKLGDGEVYYEYDPKLDCSWATPGNRNKLGIKSMYLGTEEVKVDSACRLQHGEVELSEAEGKTVGKVRCKIHKAAIKNDAEGPLAITLEYLHSLQLIGSISVIPPAS